MPWIKKNPHLVTLLVVALLVIAGSALLAMNSQSFNEKFAPVQQKVIPGDKIVPLDVTVLDETQKELEKPAEWGGTADVPLPFVPTRYQIVDGAPKKLISSGNYKHPITGDMIPNAWWIENRLNFTSSAVLNQDPDGDGFSNADEWLGKTNPNDVKSHPPYISKLYLKQYIKVAFLLKFNSYDGDPKKDKPEDMSFQINTLSVRTPSQFLKIGDPVVNGKYKIVKFEFKEGMNAKIQEMEEVSELTLENQETKALIVLVLNKVIDSPDSFALFHYAWPNPPIDFKVAKLGKFVLLPNKEQFYQVLDITDNSASIKLPSGETVNVGPAPPGVP